MHHGYELMGRAHAALASRWEERGQGTVEYVGLILLIAVVMAAIVKASGSFNDKGALPGAIVDKLKGAIGEVKTK